MSNYSKRKRPKSTINVKLAIGIFMIIAIFVVFIIMGMDALFAGSKTPATSDEVWSVIEAQGYEPEDISDFYYQKDSGFKLTLQKCIAFEKEDIHFEFFEFNNKDSAIDVYGQAYYKITTRYNSWQKMEISHKASNYSLYFLDSLGKYNVSIYVGNTAVYAYCDSEHQNEINKILAPIDYLEFGNNKETTR